MKYASQNRKEANKKKENEADRIDDAIGGLSVCLADCLLAVHKATALPFPRNSPFSYCANIRTIRYNKEIEKTRIMSQIIAIFGFQPIFDSKFKLF